MRHGNPHWLELVTQIQILSMYPVKTTISVLGETFQFCLIFTVSLQTQFYQADLKALSLVGFLVIDSLALVALTGDEKCGFLCIYAHSHVYGN